MPRRHETPDWFDEELEREEVTPEEYYASFGLSRVQWWKTYWQQEEDKRNIPPPETYSEIWKRLFPRPEPVKPTS